MAAGAEAARNSSRNTNTSNLGLRLAADGLSALAAGSLVGPVVTMIDRSIMENASGRRPMGESLLSSIRKLVLRPQALILTRPFALILMVYTSTYISANVLDTSLSTMRDRPASATTSGPAKFAATSATNLSLSLYKDSQFTKMFAAAGTKPRPVPGPMYMLFILRDSLTVFASFNVPPLLAPVLPMSAAAERWASRASVAQFVAPAAIQLVSTPLHLLGLDLYNRPDGKGRFAQVATNWLKSSAARMARIVPAFGVGGVVNTGVRKKLMTRLE